MVKKENRGLVRLNKKAQITIFMIVGLMLLFVFVFLIQLNSNLQEAQLADAKESIYSKAFKKEAMRIFVEDCLYDHLEEALITIGKQGRIWSDQPGGVKDFSEGLTGVTYESATGAERVYYGISNEEYFHHNNTYPCDNESTAPHFCQYQYPNTKLGFGKLNLKKGTIISDLRRRLIDRTIWCVESFTKSNISSKAEVETTTMELKLEILDSGIDVKVTYPFKFKIGGEEFFHLSNFDFFYLTRFNELLDAAVTFPLEQDQKYVDFAYNKSTLNKSVFQYGNPISYSSCNPYNLTAEGYEKYFYLCNRSTHLDKYTGLGIEMVKEKINDFGDDIFIFKPSLYSIVNRPEPYVFQIVRQNRPPALDYINRSQCVGESGGGYDYLVIKDEPGELGIINITAFAKDPDEDGVNIGIERYGDPGNILSLSNYLHNGPIIGRYNMSVLAKDDHGLMDWQVVRILVDRPLKVDVNINIPYQFETSTGTISYAELFDNNTYQVSTEDPVFVSIVTPEESEVSVSPVATLNYSGAKGNTENFTYVLPVDTTSPSGELRLDIATGCVGFPWLQSANCELEDYKDEIDGWKNKLISDEHNHFNQIGKGILNISFDATYCGGNVQGNYKEVEIGVRECIPHYNPERPFAFPQHGYKFGLTTDGKTNFSDFLGEDDESNSLNATHSCCSINENNPKIWGLKSKDTVCFENPEPGCYGEVVPGTQILEKEVRYCNGTRGNTCNGEFGYELKNNTLICGNNSQPGCFSVADKCQGELAFSYVDEDDDGENDGVCGGYLGCSSLEDTVVYLGDGTQTFFSLQYINQKAENLWSSHNDIKSFLENFEFGFSCNGYDGRPCSTTFDGHFKEVCASGKCTVALCAPDHKRCSGDFKIEKCNLIGTEYVFDEDCPDGYYCGGGNCILQVCTPGTKVCYSDVSPELMEEINSSEYYSDSWLDNWDLDKARFICNDKGSMYEANECSECNCRGGNCPSKGVVGKCS